VGQRSSVFRPPALVGSAFQVPSPGHFAIRADYIVASLLMFAKKQMEGRAPSQQMF